MLTVPSGKQALELVKLAYAANQPVLFSGAHGIGKSSLLAQVAQELEIELICRDLSLMEPPDLVGIPARNVDDGRTHYAPPAFLPTTGRGLFVFEELNRSPRYMQCPALELCTNRTLNDYTLPAGWLPVAAINEGSAYQVDELDEALRSRFLQVRLTADVEAWLDWAWKKVHPKITRFVQQSEKIFEDHEANPRAWTYASRLLENWEAGDHRDELLLAALSGVLSDTWATAFFHFYKDDGAPLSADQIMARYSSHRRLFRAWVKKGRLDLVGASLAALKKRLGKEEVYQFLQDDQLGRTNVERFIADLPADLREQIDAWLQEKGYDLLISSNDRMAF
jgi:hypothetical protein